LVSDYPVVLQLAGKRCVVVGAGPVGLRKARRLCEVSADVILIDPARDRVDTPAGATMINRAFRQDDLDGASLVFAATNNQQVNRAVAEAARALGIPVNVADDPAASDFTVPASFSRGNLSIAVSSGGVSPAIAAMVRDEVETLLPDAWQIFLEIAGELRARLLTSDHKAAYNQQVLQNLVSGGILTMIENFDSSGVDQLVTAEFGNGYSLADLGISLPKDSP